MVRRLERMFVMRWLVGMKRLYRIVEMRGLAGGLERMVGTRWDWK
jgi:hypothetical protein